MELNRELIVKALECCTRGRKSKEDRPCLDCPYNECNLVGGTSERQTKGTCQGWLMKDALALIKELTEENERLTERLEREAKCQYDLCGQIVDLKEENERLIADNTVLLETMHTPHKEPEGTLRIKLNVPKGSDTIYRLRSAKQIKIDTVGEMQRLLMLEYSDCINEETISVGGLRENIDKIIKKMLED